MIEELNEHYDVVVIGGGAAGLNGALMLARARRSVAVIDAGSPRNAPAEGVHGLLGREGMPPGELLERGRGEVRGYGGQVVPGEVDVVARDGDDFDVTLVDGRRTRARRLLVTSGVVDELPDIAGLREHWGIDVVHCPYCHGWEIRDQAIGVLALGPLAVHQALMFRQWSDDVVFLTHTAPPPTVEDVERLAARGIPVVNGEVVGLEVDDGRLSGVRLRDGRVIARSAVAAAPRTTVRGAFLDGLGLRPVEHPAGVGNFIPSDAGGGSDVPGVWVAGNITEPMSQVGASAAAGAMAGAQINADLINEEVRLAVEAARDPFSAKAARDPFTADAESIVSGRAASARRTVSERPQRE
ncbi:NAD(P)/FAD-dependent oxidoreductase [Stackebrandtia soli]|uniref:NAD(P)/FAD-dependent oxidoreductase n=1 Tax=Stackebrandtia soli TaxID=1892856 RepID=UPI0039EB3D75